MRRICPLPTVWNTLYEGLLRVAKERPDLPEPPVPLILNGWVFSSDDEKEARWSDTVRWAESAGCTDAIQTLAAADFYSAS
jgi:hypothetical protein